MNAIQYFQWGNGELPAITPIFRGFIEAVEQNRNPITYEHFSSGHSAEVQNYECRFNFKNADWSWFYHKISKNQTEHFALHLDSDEILVNTENQKIAYSHTSRGGEIVHFYDGDFLLEYDKNIFEKCEVFKLENYVFSAIVFYLKNPLVFKENIDKSRFYQQTRIKIKEKFLGKRIKEDIQLKIIFENN